MKKNIKSFFSIIVAVLKKMAQYFLLITSWLYLVLWKKPKSLLISAWIWVKGIFLKCCFKMLELYVKGRRGIKKVQYRGSRFDYLVLKKISVKGFLTTIIYMALLLIGYYLFCSFNRIPNYIFSVDINKLNNYRYISKSTNKKSYYNLHYQIADIHLTIPRKEIRTNNKTNKLLFHKKKALFSGIIYEDSISIKYATILKKGKKLIYTPDLNPYWSHVFFLANYKNENEANYINYSDFKNKKEIVYMHDKYYFENYFDSENLQKMITIIPDSLSESMSHFYHLKLSINNEEIKNNKESSLKPRSWIDTINYVKVSKEATPYIRQFTYERMGIRSINNEYHSYWEYYTGNNSPMYIINGFSQNQTSKMDNHSIKIKIINKLKKYLSIDNNIPVTEKPDWFSLYDISKGWYKININTTSIDSICLNINFLGATEFFPMGLEPDEQGSNYIVFKDASKIQRIQNEGLCFYAAYKEMENYQTIRCFILTALLSGLLIILVTRAFEFLITIAQDSSDYINQRIVNFYRNYRKKI